MGIDSSSNRAIVIGIDRFDHFDTLDLAEADARAFARVLQDELGWSDVTLLLGSELQRKGVVNITHTVQALLDDLFLGPGTSPDSFLVIYYAGHGFLNMKRDKGYLAFPETDEQHPATAIAMDHILNDLVLGTDAGRVVAILDCCHSGAAFRGIRTRSTRSQRGEHRSDLLLGEKNIDSLRRATVPSGASRTPRGKVVLTSCRADELVLEDEAIDDGVPTGVSVYTHTLCDGWRGGKDGRAITNATRNRGEPKVTSGSLYEYLDEELSTLTHRPMIYEPPRSGNLVINSRPRPRAARPASTTAPVHSSYLTDLSFTAWSSKGVIYMLPPFVYIRNDRPFEMGSSRQEVAVYKKRTEYANEYSEQTVSNRHPVSVEDFEIAAYPVTVAEYARFLEASDEPARIQHTPPDWQTQRTRPEMPITKVSWHDASAYCAWLSSVADLEYRPCSEAQWEKAARWGPGATRSKVYALGDEFARDLCNFLSGNLERVGEHRADVSDYGVHDLTGNVAEWTRSLLLPYPYDSRRAEEGDTTAVRTVRGGSYQDDSAGDVRAARRHGYSPDSRWEDLGFRLVRSSRTAQNR